MHFSHLWGRTSNHELDSKHSEDFQARNLQPKSSTIRFSSRPMGDEPRQSAAAPRPPRHAFHPAVPGSGLCKGRTVIICQNAVINLATCSRFQCLHLSKNRERVYNLSGRIGDNACGAGATPEDPFLQTFPRPRCVAKFTQKTCFKDHGTVGLRRCAELTSPGIRDAKYDYQ